MVFGRLSLFAQRNEISLNCHCITDFFIEIVQQLPVISLAFNGMALKNNFHSFF